MTLLCDSESLEDELIVHMLSILQRSRRTFGSFWNSFSTSNLHFWTWAAERVGISVGIHQYSSAIGWGCMDV